MHALFRLPLLSAAALVVLGAPVARAQSPLPDPVAPAVVGRPLDQIVRAKPARPKAVPIKPAPARTAAARPAAPTPVATAPTVARTVATAATVKAAPAEGPYFTDATRSAARKYYEEHTVMRPAVHWKIGEAVPRDVVAALVPPSLLAVLPQAPRGHFYAELGGDVVLLTVDSHVVVDGISRGRGITAVVSR